MRITLKLLLLAPRGAATGFPLILPYHKHTHFVPSYFQAISTMPFDIVIRITELLLLSKSLRTNALDLWYLPSLSSSKASRAEQ